MKSPQQQHPNLAFEKMSSSPWNVTKRRRLTMEEFESGSNCTASTMNSSSSYDYSSASSFSSLSSPTIARKTQSKQPQLPSLSNGHSSAIHTQNPRPIEMEIETETAIETKPIIPPYTIPKELQDYCGKGKYWMVPTTKKRLRTIGGDSCLTALDLTSRVSPITRRLHRSRSLATDNINKSRVSGNANPNFPHCKQKKIIRKRERSKANRGTRNRETNPDQIIDINIFGANNQNETRLRDAFPDSSTTSYSNNSNNNNNSSNNSMYNEGDGKVKIIGLRGIRSIWAWIDVDAHVDVDIKKKTESSQTYCNKGNISEKEEFINKTDNNTNAELSAPSAAANHAGDGDSKKNIPERSMGSNAKVLRELQDHCGRGSYWTVPTQRRRKMSTKLDINAASGIGKRNQRAASSKTITVSDRMSDCNYTDRSIINTSLPTSKNAQRSTWNWNYEKEDAPSSLTNIIGTVKNGTTTKTASNIDDTRNIGDVTKITGKEGKSTTEAFDDRTEATTTTAKSKAAHAISATCNYPVKQKNMFRAMEGPNQPIVQYALEMISLVCNNSCTTNDSMNGTLQQDGSKHCCWSYQQVHRVLDKPQLWHTTETESEKERLMRLQFRQRFASATSAGMSPIEFAKKLLGLWGGKLEQVVVSVDE